MSPNPSHCPAARERTGRPHNHHDSRGSEFTAKGGGCGSFNMESNILLCGHSHRGMGTIELVTNDSVVASAFCSIVLSNIKITFFFLFSWVAVFLCLYFQLPLNALLFKNRWSDNAI